MQEFIDSHTLPRPRNIKKMLIFYQLRQVLVPEEGKHNDWNKGKTRNKKYRNHDSHLGHLHVSLENVGVWAGNCCPPLYSSLQVHNQYAYTDNNHEESNKRKDEAVDCESHFLSSRIQEEFCSWVEKTFMSSLLLANSGAADNARMTKIETMMADTRSLVTILFKISKTLSLLTQKIKVRLFMSESTLHLQATWCSWYCFNCLGSQAGKQNIRQDAWNQKKVKC